MAEQASRALSSKAGLQTQTLESVDVHEMALRGIDRDTQVLALSGKKQVLKRRFGLLSMSGLALTNTGTWQTVVVTLGVGLANGGPAGVIYGCIICWIGMTSVFICMGELSSMTPTAAGQYHFAAQLASKRWKAPLSYCTGWITCVTWVIAPTVNTFLASTITLQLISFLNPSYTPAPWHGVLLMWGILSLIVITNTILGAYLAIIELTFLILHVIGFFGLLIPLANLGGQASNAYEIFTTFNNQGNWSSLGLAFLVGLQGNAGAFVGGDCAIHMAEEMQNAELNVARSMNIAIALNGAMAFVAAVVVCHVGGDLNALLDAQYPIMNIIYNVTNSRGATAALVGYYAFMGFAAGCSSVASGSRMTWAFARDNGLPFSRFLRHVDRRLAIPMRAIGVVTISAALLGLIQLGSSVVLNIVLSLIVVGYYSSYLCVLFPLLYHRATGNIRDPATNDYPNARLRWGPYKLKGLLGTLNNAFAICYLLVVGFFTFWPPTSSPDAVSMNYSSLLLGGTALLSLGYYLLRARKNFTGPVVEIVTND